MPYTATSFAKKHNKKLHGEAAAKAASMATAMEREGVDPGIAIATANKKGNQMQRKKSPLYRHERSPQ
jgi:uncharacterized protein YdaT